MERQVFLAARFEPFLFCKNPAQDRKPRKQRISEQEFHESEEEWLLTVTDIREPIQVLAQP